MSDLKEREETATPEELEQAIAKHRKSASDWYDRAGDPVPYWDHDLWEFLSSDTWEDGQ